MKLLRHTLSQHDLIEATTADEALYLFGERRRYVDCNLPVILTSGYPVSSWSVRGTIDMQRLGSNSVAFIQNSFRLKSYCAWLRNCLELHRQKARRLIGGIRNGLGARADPRRASRPSE